MQKLWCIINIQYLSSGHYFAGGSRYGYRLDKEHGPTAFYEDRKQAEAELFRLSEKDGKFAIFELCGYVVQSQVTITAAHIEAPDSIQDEIPF